MSRLYVGHLPRDVRERDIERLFKGYGQIRDICLLSGFGFVEFRDRRDADDVMRDFDDREFMGDRLVVEPARAERRRDRSDRGGFDRRGPPPPGRGRSTAPQRTPYRVLVDNLSSTVSWQVSLLCKNACFLSLFFVYLVAGLDLFASEDRKRGRTEEGSRCVAEGRGRQKKLTTTGFNHSF